MSYPGRSPERAGQPRYKRSIDRFEYTEAGKEKRRKLRHAKEGLGLVPEKSHFLTSLQQHFDTVYGKEKLGIQIVLDANLDAFVQKDARQIYITSGLIQEFDAYLQSQGKRLSYDHLVFLLGREKWALDAKAATPELRETFCDIESTKSMAAAGYNPLVAEDGVGFIQYMNNSYFGLTHDRFEAKVSEVQKLLYDPNYFLLNTRKPVQEVTPILLKEIQPDSALHTQSLRIQQETDMQRLLNRIEKQTNISTVIEGIQKVSDLLTEGLADALVEDPRFGKILFGYALLAETHQYNGRIYESRYFRDVDSIVVDDVEPDRKILTHLINPQSSVSDILKYFEDELTQQLNTDLPHADFVTNKRREKIKEIWQTVLPISDFGLEQVKNILVGNSPFYSDLVNSTDPFTFNKFFDMLEKPLHTIAKQQEKDTQNVQDGKRQNQYIYTGSNLGEFCEESTLRAEDYEPPYGVMTQDAQNGRARALNIGLKAWAKTLIRERFVLTEPLKKNIDGIKAKVHEVLTSALLVQYPSADTSSADMLADIILQYYWIGNASKPVTLDSLPLDQLSKKQKESLLRMLDSMHLDILYGGYEYDKTREVADKYKNPNTNLNQLLFSLRDALEKAEPFQPNTVTLAQRWKEDRPFVEGQEVPQNTKQVFFSRILQETSSTMVRSILDSVEYKPNIVGIFLLNKNIPQDQKLSIIGESLQRGKLATGDIAEILYSAFSSADTSKFFDTNDEKNEWKLFWSRNLFPLIPMDDERNGYRDAVFAHTFNSIFARKDRKHPADKIIEFFQMGGVLSPFTDVKMRPSLNAALASSRNEVPFDILETLQEIAPHQLEYLANALTATIQGRLGQFSEEERERVTSFIFQVKVLHSLTLDKANRKMESPIPSSPYIISQPELNNFLNSVNTLPQCKWKDDFIWNTLFYNGLENNQYAIRQVLPLLMPIEKIDQTAKESARENRFGALDVLVSSDGDSRDIGQVTQVTLSKKAQLIEKLLSLPQEQEAWKRATLEQKLSEIDRLIPENCKYKDVLVRRFIEDRIKEIERLPGKREEQKKLKQIILERLQSKSNTSHTILDISTRVYLGYRGIQLEKALDERIFSVYFRGRDVIKRYLSEYSFRRDEVLIELLNGTNTTQDEIKEAMGLMISNNYRTDLHDVNTARGGNEALGFYFNSLSQEDKGEFILWLLDSSRTPKTIDEAKRKLLKSGSSIQIPWSIHSIEELSKQETYAEEYAAVMNLGLPEKMVESLGKNHMLSVRTSFFGMTDTERREFLFDFLIGKEGVFVGDEKTSKKFLQNFTEILMRKVSLSQNTKNMLGDIFVEGFMALPPEAQANNFLQLLSLIATEKGEVQNGPKVVKGVLQSFGVVGAKLGQILSEQASLIPDAEYRRELRELKDSVKPASKIFTLQAMDADGLLEKNRSLTVGRLLGSASIKQVYEMKTRDSEFVGKFLRPQADASVSQGFEAVKHALEHITQKYGVNSGRRKEDQIIVPENLITRLHTLVEQETDFVHEAKNTREMRDALKNHKVGQYTVVAPEVIEGAGRSIFETRAAGVSLAQYEKANQVTNDMYEAVVAEWLHECFEIGKVHGDLHAANVYFAPNTMTLIDWGLTVDLQNKATRKDFLSLLIGINDGNIESVASVIKNYTSAQIATNLEERLRMQLEKSQTKAEKVQGIIETISMYNPDDVLLGFMKSLISVSNYIEALPKGTMEKLVKNHLSGLQLLGVAGRFLTGRR